MERIPLIQRPFAFRFYNVSLILITVNVGVFLLLYLAGSLYQYLAMIPGAVIVLDWWWQVVTYMFVHAGIWHLVLNMLALFMFGQQLERRIGSTEFLIFYLVSGIGAGLISLLIYWLTGAYGVALVGASGAVFGVLLAFATYFPTATILLFGIVPVRAPLLVVGYAAIELFSMFARTRGNVAHLTHLAGLAVAFLYLVVRLRINPIREFMGGRRY